jgi:sensor histidine kinase YesM
MAHLSDTGMGPELCVVVRNTGSPMRARSASGSGGVGVRNVERRLACYYGDAASLTLRSDEDGATVAELRLPTIDADGQNARVVSRVAPA